MIEQLMTTIPLTTAVAIIGYVVYIIGTFVTQSFIIPLYPVWRPTLLALIPAMFVDFFVTWGSFCI